MIAKKYRWSRVYESAEEELLDFLADKNISPTRHELESGETLAAQTAAADMHIWAADGTAMVTIDGKKISTQAGDTLDIPAGATYEIATHLSTFVWYQS